MPGLAEEFVIMYRDHSWVLVLWLCDWCNLR